MSTKVLSILALVATVCFLLLITLQVMEMNKYGSADPAPSATTTPAAEAPAPAAAAETPAPAAE